MKAFSVSVTLVVLLAFLAACAPTPAPVATPAPAPAAKPLAAPAAGPVQTAEEVAWQKVISAARKEGKVTLYAWAFTGDIGTEISRIFKEKYGVTVEIITGRGNEQIERLKTEQRIGNVVADVMESSILNVVNAKDIGVVVSPGDLPSLREKNVWLMPPGLDAESTVFAYQAAPMVVWAHKNMKPEDAPQSWKDLLNPRWKGKLVMADPTVSSGPYLAFIPLLNARAIDEDYLRSLGNQDVFLEVGSTRDVAKKVGSGEYLLAMAISSSSAGPLVKEGLPLKPLDMIEGVGVSGLGVAMVKQSSHPNAARLFLNWSLSAEGQAKLSELISSPGVRSDVPDFSVPGVRIKPKKLMPLTVKDMADQSRLFQAKYLLQFFKRGK
ncbi:MAG: extracellular solute-binding protein [Chloroflexi bacterium]|nr:extracellular solute-binding protein [Chloroflexota bacterium]